MAKILDGKSLSREMSLELKERISLLSLKPKLNIIQVGNRKESGIYINHKMRFGEEIGVQVEHLKYPEGATEGELLEKIAGMNGDPSVHGIIIQLPLPAHLDRTRLMESIAPRKDVDGLTSANTWLLFNKMPALVPATARGIMTLLERHEISVKGKKVVVVGQSALVGRPTAILMLNLGATVTVCNSDTKDLKRETREAEIIVSAVGKKGLITGEHVSPGQIVVDVGINVVDGKLSGDVNFEEVGKIVDAITPVPGGVGPMTVASLFENLIDAAKS